MTGIKVDDGSDQEKNEAPEDDRFTDLIAEAENLEIECQAAIVDMELIVPFSDYKPTITAEYRDEFLEAFDADSPPEIYLYEHEGQLIMSDDYDTFALYKAVEAEQVIAIIIGPFTPNPGIQPVGDPYTLSE